jgi:tetratricopeptide (TPR) repeat protein
VKRSQGQIAEAKADFERARDLRVRAFGTQHIKHAESIESLAAFERDLDKRKAMLQEALAIVTAPGNQSPRTPFVEYSLESGLAEIAGRQDDQAAMQRHFDRAVALAEKLSGPMSLDVGMLLIGYGQHMSKVDLEQSFTKLRRAIEILESLHDARAQIARGALAMMLMMDKRYREALPVLEQAVAAVDLKNVEPVNLAMMRFSLARALVETGGDRARARALATQALDGYRALGPDVAANARDVEKFLKKYR